MDTTICYHKNNPHFWLFGFFVFLYFFVMATCFPFLPIWLSEIIGLNKTETGVVFSCISLFAIIFQPILGLVSDKLGLRKNLLWFMTILLFLFAPFFIYVFAPVLKTNSLLGALLGGIYIGFIFSAGSGAVEAYVERASRNNAFQYGKARMFGCFGWGICASTTGVLFSINPDIVFWMGSGAALLMMILLWIAHPARPSETGIIANSTSPSQAPFSFALVKNLFSQRKFWFLIIYVIGVACIYDVFDQQFANFFKSFFATQDEGNQIFGFVTTAGELANAIVMFCTPWIMSRIGAKNTLLIAGVIMTIRITGSSFASSVIEVVILKMLHALEVPFLLIGVFKYITEVFDTRLSATIYLIGFNFAKQCASIFLSAFAGHMYDKIGFSQTYLMLGCIALTFTVVSVFTLTNTRKQTENVSETVASHS